jgi:hypothetical protein
VLRAVRVLRVLRAVRALRVLRAVRAFRVPPALRAVRVVRADRGRRVVLAPGGFLVLQALQGVPAPHVVPEPLGSHAVLVARGRRGYRSGDPARPGARVAARTRRHQKTLRVPAEP